MVKTDTISVNQSLTFDVLSEVLGVDVEVLKELNPIYKRNPIPVSKTRQHFLDWFGTQSMAKFVNNSDTIYAYNQATQEKYVSVDQIPLYTVVQKGEYLGKIAGQYHTTIGRIKNWNNLSSSNLRVGQNLLYTLILI